jgi:RecB family exonuclease
MSVRLILAPAGAGKTAWALDRARAATRRLEGLAYVCVASRLQARSCRRRLAQGGGAMGVHVVTFEGLAAACLNAVGAPYAELDEAVQHRLLRSVLQGLDLPYYGRLAASPGLVQLLRRLVEELAAADVNPGRLEGALADMGAEPRLAELARIYRAYCEQRRALGFVDRAALPSLARDAIAGRVTGHQFGPADAFRGWSLLVVDGFDNLTPAQLALLRVLASRLPEVVVTLTGDVGAAIPLVWRRFRRTQEDLERALGVHAEPLPPSVDRNAGILAHLEAGLRGVAPGGVHACGGVRMLEVPDRSSEVREALRWLKERLVHDGLAPGEVALLARDMDAYRSYVLQVAAEMGLPLRVAGGVPLAGVPVIAALLDLLRLALPAGGDTAEPALPRRLVVEAWRSPYIDWDALLPCDPACPWLVEGAAPIRGAAVAGALDSAARWGRVVGGWAQWEEALTRLAAFPPPDDEAERDDDGMGLNAPSGRVPVGDQARCLLCRLRRFVARVSPTESAQTFRQHVAWLEELIGADDTGSAREGGNPDGAERPSGGIVARIRARCGAAGDADAVDAAAAAAAAVAERDIEALRALKDVLRGLVAAEALLADGEPVGQAAFFAELTGALEAARLSMPMPSDRDEVLAADVVAARGIPFRAVALLGLAEGEFPAILGEDVLLRDADRRMLLARGVPLELPTESAEPERFYEAVTRASESLLLTRPRLADNGAAWAPSPFWEEMRRLVGAEPMALASESAPPPDRAASWPELLASLAAYPWEEDACQWAQRHGPERWQALESAAQIVSARSGQGLTGAYDGNLGALRDELAGRYGALHVWSATRLEQYRACPFMFYVGSVLQLEPRVEPVEGLDGRQLGSIYHRLFEAYYADGGPQSDLTEWAQRVAGPILDQAPVREGFRETAWWPQTRAEILANFLRSIVALGQSAEGYVEVLCEQPFGGDRPLVLHDGDDLMRLNGFIDRVDRSADGGLRIIDYKTSGPSEYSAAAVVEGRKLQLPLYALAARDALGLGEPREGFYWHVQHAKASGFSLGRFDGGPEAAMAAAATAAWEAVRAARRGEFAPHPLRGGCPSYCPAAAFCWSYRPGFA